MIRLLFSLEKPIPHEWVLEQDTNLIFFLGEFRAARQGWMGWRWAGGLWHLLFDCCCFFGLAWALDSGINFENGIFLRTAVCLFFLLDCFGEKRMGYIGGC